MNEERVRILVVEDNPSDVQVIRRLIGDSTSPVFEITAADRVAKGVAALAETNPDVILLDLGLPDSNPEELDSFSRIHEVAAGVPIIVMTGMSDQEVAAKAVRLGAQDFLVKGEVSAELLKRSIRYSIERQRADEDLRESEERYALAVDGANDGLWDWNLDEDRIYLSPRWKAILGYDEDELSSAPAEWLDRVHPDDLHRLKSDLEAHLHELGEQSPLFAAHFENEHRIRHRDGAYRWVLSRGIAIRDAAGHPYRMAGSLTDVTMRKNAEERLLHDALHDALTGLPNRALFLDRLGVALARTRRRRDDDRTDCSAVLFLDLDRFKHVNDSLGHVAGDRLLVAMARRLESILRPGDTVARLGGDEFAILVDIARASDTEVVAERIHKEFSVPFNVDGHELLATVSIGIARVTASYVRPEDLLRDADIAMYQAKSEGRAGYRVFDSTMHTRAAAMLKLESDLSQALRKDELRLHYQPVMALASARVVGFEALLRWEHPERGLIMPADIIDVAEDTGLIVPIGIWVMEEACRQMAEWQADHEIARSMSMSINLSSKQLMQPDMVEVIVRVLGDSGLEPSCLRLELTESVLMDNADSAVAKLSQLRKLGVQVYIDDFGTGYSSLSYLQRLPVDTLKIDRTFISQLGLQAESVEIVSAIITLARNLGMSVAAEGVETAEQAEGLKALDCEYGQGYYFYRPLDGESVEALFSN
jgi:diguanylate cyclase (GGDEF)-like protein/PAS domain S-box-containing protein